jgi:hypothetical protein
MTQKHPNPGKGRFVPGQSGNPKGRPKKVRSVDAAVLDAINEKVMINQNGNRKRVSMVDVAAKQLAKKSAAGDLRATKMTLDYAQKAEERQGETESRKAVMTASDEEIAARVIERLERVILAREDMNNPQTAKSGDPTILPTEGDL